MQCTYITCALKPGVDVMITILQTHLITLAELYTIIPTCEEINVTYI
jgi:hypothetical protein